MMRGALIGIFGILLLSTTTLGFAQTDSEIFPEWVKTTIKFWADGFVTDAELKNAIEYLIETKIIVIDKSTVEFSEVFPISSTKVISGISLVGLDLSGVDFAGATIIDVDFSGTDLSGKDFTDANLTLADLTNSKIQYTIFDGIHTDGCEGCP